MANWYTTFTQLREAGISLKDWLEFHRIRRSELTPAQRKAEEK
jgi:hypothetical protein